MTKYRTLAEVVGSNAHAIRTSSGATLEQVSRAARAAGLKWSTGRVGDMERGGVSPTLPTLIALAQALGDATGERQSVTNLVETDGWVALSDGLVVSADAVTAAARGEKVNLGVGQVEGELPDLIDAVTAARGLLEALPHDLKAGRLRRAMKSWGLADERAARQLGLTKGELLVITAALWGESLTAERERRAPDTTSPQARGRVTRILIDEIRAAVGTGRGND